MSIIWDKNSTLLDILSFYSFRKKMDSFNQIVAEQAKILANKPTWSAISAENVAKMKIQNRFKTGTEIAKYCSEIMRKDIAEFEADDTKYTQSLGCWHG